VRTGESQPVVITPGCDTPLETVDYEVLLRPTFRFYGTPGKGPNSHFFTVNRQECFAVTQDAGWQYETSPFWAGPPRDGGTCAADTIPLYRLYNNRAAQNDSNHRFTTKQTIVDAMVAQGWINEGTAMCVTR
jgi:serine protease